MKTVILCVFFVSWFVGCSKKSPEFHLLRIQDSSLSMREPSNVIATRSFVVSNIPDNIDSLANLAFFFAKRNSDNPNYPRFWVSFNFFRETRFTPRTFIEKDERGGSIHDHGDDYLLGVNHVKSFTRDCWFLTIKGREGPSPLDTCIDLSPLSHDSTKVAP